MAGGPRNVDRVRDSRERTTFRAYQLDHARDEARLDLRDRPLVPGMTGVPEGDDVVDAQPFRLRAVLLAKDDAHLTEDLDLRADPERLRVHEETIHVEDDGAEHERSVASLLRVDEPPLLGIGHRDGAGIDDLDVHGVDASLRELLDPTKACDDNSQSVPASAIFLGPMKTRMYERTSPGSVFCTPVYVTPW